MQWRSWRTPRIAWGRGPSVIDFYLPKIILPLSDTEMPPRFPVVSSLLIGLNTLIYFGMLFFVSDWNAVYADVGLRPALLWQGHVLPLVTSMFFHDGFSHLVFNMVFLWVFAPRLENKLGPAMFLFLYVFSDLMANMGHSLAYPSSQMPSIGASGAISGLMGAYVIVFPWAKINTLVISRIIRIPALLYILTWFASQSFMGYIALQQKGPQRRGVAGAREWFSGRLYCGARVRNGAGANAPGRAGLTESESRVGLSTATVDSF